MPPSEVGTRDTDEGYINLSKRVWAGLRLLCRAWWALRAATA